MASKDLSQHIHKIIEIGIALTAEKDFNELLNMILVEARKITNADGGTFYIIEDEKLTYKVMQNKTLGTDMGGNKGAIPFPPIEMDKRNISAYTAITREIVNIEDVYNTDIFDFSGPKKFDEAVGYKTKSFLVVPLVNREAKVIGVLQLINALDENDKPIPFDVIYEPIINALGSFASIAIANTQYIQEIKQFFDQFVEVMVVAIDKRTPYNANHSRHIADLSEKFMSYLNTVKEGDYKDLFFSDSHIKQLSTAAWLHDIGKIAIPTSVMDKATRLGSNFETVMIRLNYLKEKAKATCYEKCLGHLEEKDEILTKWKIEDDYLREVIEFIDAADKPWTFIDDEKEKKLKEIYHYKFNCEAIKDPLLTLDELDQLLVKKGTLTSEERKIIESHVIVGEEMLEKLKFPDYLSDVPKWAVCHHEFLNGEGYPRRLTCDELGIEPRILALLDIYDALVARDRPYKKALPIEKALEIMGFMVKDGQLDGGLLQQFIKSEIWKED